MTQKTTLNDFKDDLHISHSQIFTYQSCSLKYFYQYVEQRRAESISIALSFGSSIHTVLDLYYRALKNGRQPETLDTMSQFFEKSLALNLESTEVPILYNKSMPDTKTALEMGKSLVKTFYKSVDLTDSQMSAYSYLLATNKYIPLTASIECRFDVLLKLKTKPRLQQIYTIRTREDRRRFAKVANTVLAGIEAKIFMPQPSWMCKGCQFAEACSEW